MGSILSVIFAILFHGLAQEGYALDGEFLGWLPIGLALPYALSAWSRRAVLAGDLRRARLLLLVAESSGWFSYAVLLLACGWLGTVRRWTGADLSIDSWPDFALLVSFSPFPLLQAAAIDAGVRAHGGSRVVQRHLRSFQLRMFVACIAPISVFIAASGLLGKSEWLRTQVEHVGLASALFTGLMVLALAQLLPMLLRWSWDTEPFPEGPQRELLESVAARAGFRPRDIRLWRTGDLMANAAIVGFGRSGRTVLFSDHLLSILNSRELCAVYAHEIGHAQRGHVPVFLAWTAGFIFLGDAAARATFEASGATASAGVVGAIALFWYASFGWLSRRYELDADLHSLDIVGDLPALTGALERVGGRDRERSGWRHFGVARRIRFLARAAGDPRFAAAFRGRLRVASVLAVVLALVGGVTQLWGLVGDLPEDRAVVSLARGKYERAAQLAASLDDESGAELRRLAAAAGSIENGSVAAARAAVLRALGERDLGAALDLARVAALRGVDSARSVASVLERAKDGDVRGVTRGLEALDEGWRPAVRSALRPASPATGYE